MKYSFTAVEHGQKLHRYTTNVCRSRAIKDQCTTGKERRITPGEVLEKKGSKPSMLLRPSLPAGFATTCQP
jgi:hypothetical protein